MTARTLLAACALAAAAPAAAQSGWGRDGYDPQDDCDSEGMFRRSSVSSRNDAFGFRLVGLGDVDGDGDGVDDFAVGAPLLRAAEGAHQGGVVVFSGASREVLRTIRGESWDRQYGRLLCAVADRDGDGVRDLVVGGAVGSQLRLHSGATGEVLVVPLDDDDLYAGDGVVAEVGDADGDGLPEVAVGNPGMDYEGVDTGVLFLLAFADGGSRDVGYLRGGGAGDGFGHRVARAGDLDGDGVADLLVSSHRGNLPSRSRSTRPSIVQAFSGKTSALLYTVEGKDPDECFGQTLCALGDVDGDGVDDFAVGAPGNPLPHLNEFLARRPCGAVRILSGRDGSVLRELRWEDVAEVSSFGYALASADLDADGTADLVVGSYSIHFDARVTAYSGESFGRMWTKRYRGPGGGRVAVPGDLDDDGAPDVLIQVGSLGYTFDGEGRVELLSSRDCRWIDAVAAPREEEPAEPR